MLNIKWTTETLKEESKKYHSVSEWRKNSYSSYVIACQKGVYAELSKNMKKHHKWYKNTVLEEAKKYNSRMEWRYASSGSYDAAITHGWLEEATAHMELMTNKSKPEREILSHVLIKHSDARKARFGKRTKGSIGQGLELDIFIPSLNKGIEFDGEYWHGKGFKPTSFAKTPEESRLYKDKFFNSLSIQIIRIQEKEWLESKTNCLQKVDEFLRND